MKIKSIFLTVLFFISIFFVQSCDTTEITNSTNDLTAIDPSVNDPTKSRVQLKLVDAPDDDYNEVWVEIIDVQYNRNDDDAGWTSFDGYPKSPGDKVDLLSLTAGSDHILTDQEIESGMLSKVRLVLGEDNYLYINKDLENKVPLKTPSAQQSGLKLHLNTELVAGYSYTFILDWDVQKSIVKAGNSGNYNLKPVIRVIAEVNSGTILGRVADIEETEEGAEPMPLDNATVYVYPDDTYTPGTDITNALTSDEEGSEGLFMIQGLPGGEFGTDYFLRVVKDDYDVFDYGPVTVLNGQDTDVETLYLTKSTGSIIGLVQDGADSLPIMGATVNVYAKEDDTTIITTTLTSDVVDSEGTFEIPDLLPGEYILKIVKDPPYDKFTYVGDSEGIIKVKINETSDLGILFLTKTVVP